MLRLNLEKLSIALIAFALYGTSYAADNANTSNNFNRFYVGAGFGYDTLSAKRHEETSGTSTYGDSTTDTSMNAHGLLVNAVAGRGWTFNRMYTGLEAQLYGSNNNGCNTTSGVYSGNSYSSKDCFKETYGFGLQGQLGYLASENVLYYVGVGPVESRFRSSQSYKYTTQTTTTDQSHYRYAMGAQAAIGTKWQFSEPFALQAEYVYSAYPSISVPEVENNQLKYKEIRDGEAHLNLLYYFG